MGNFIEVGEHSKEAIEDEAEFFELHDNFD